VLLTDSHTVAIAEPVLVDCATGRRITETDYVTVPGPLRTSEPDEGSPLPRGNAMSDAAVDRVVLPIPVRAPSGALRKRVLIACIALIVAVGAAWYGHYWWTVARFVESTDDALSAAR
jgi:hypothetical protein